MTTASPDTRPKVHPSDRPAGPARLAFGLVVGSCVLLVAALWLWSVSTPWDRPWYPLLLIPLAFLVFWLCAGGHGRLSWKIAGYEVLAVGSIALVVVSVGGTIGDASYNDRLIVLEPTAQEILNDPGASGRCFAPSGEYTTFDYAGLGTPDEICVSVFEDRGNGAAERVQFTWGVRSLVFEGATPHPSMSQCSRHLHNEWWAQVEEDPDCPMGFQYRGV